MGICVCVPPAWGRATNHLGAGFCKGEESMQCATKYQEEHLNVLLQRCPVMPAASGVDFFSSSSFHISHLFIFFLHFPSS